LAGRATGLAPRCEAILFVDLSASELIDGIAREMKAAVARFYADEGSPQEEMWCTLERIDVV